MRKIFALPFRLVTPMFALCLMAAPLAAQQITETFSHNAHSFQMQFVKIGDAGNSGKNAGLSRPIGDVNYEYWIGKFEVDAWQIAVGNASGIVGVSVADWNHRGYTFGTNPPATGISWQEAARFVNWMNISKGYSPAYKFASYDPFNSYDPTYTGLNDMMMLWDPNDVGYNPNNPFRNSRARYFLPSLDEWFKAAFYDPTLNSGNGGYWDFPTTSNTAPTPVPGGAVGAVYGSQTGPANVDDAGSLSWYGTMAQGGNVYELAETAFDLNNNDINKNRAVVGGGWGSPATQISSDFMISRTPSEPNDSYGIGFRVAMVVEPPDSDLDQDGVNYYRELKDGTNPNDATSFNPLSKGLVAFYPFDGNANDESGFMRTAKLSANAQYGVRGTGSGKALKIMGKGFFFRENVAEIPALDKSNAGEFVEIPEPSLIDRGVFTASIWVNEEGMSHEHGETYITAGYAGDSLALVGNYYLYGGQSSLMTQRALTFESSLYQDLASPVQLSEIQSFWINYTVVSDGATISLYKNGERVHFGDCTAKPRGNWSIGRHWWDTGDTFSTRFIGSVSDFRVYNRALSPTEVSQLYQTEAHNLDTDNDGVNNYRENKDGTNPNDANSFNPLSKGLVAYYPFDGNANDESGYELNGILTGATFTNDHLQRNNSAIYFAGSGEQVTLPYSPNCYDVGARDFSYAFWIRHDGPSAFERIGGGSTLDGRRFWFETAHGFLRVYSYDAQLQQIDWHPPQQVGVGEWSSVVLNRQSGILQLFVNGVKTHETDYAHTIRTSFDTFTLGVNLGLSEYFKGSLDNLRIYNRSLSPSEVGQLYRSEGGTLDTDNDGIPDDYETNTGVFVSPTDTGTDPNNPDSDSDGLNDGFETNTSVWVSASDTGTDPNNPDSDSDGLNDSVETNTGTYVSATSTGTNPLISDTSGDGITDGEAVAAHFNPLIDQRPVLNFLAQAVAAQPNRFGFYNEANVMHLAMGGLMIRKSGSAVNLDLQWQTKNSMTNAWTNHGAPMPFFLNLPGSRAFIRLQATPGAP